MNSSLELGATFGGIFRGKRVLVTGHTGFKGSWLCEWLLALGADVTGLALAPPTQPALFDQLGLAGRLHDRRGDIRDLATVRAAVAAAQPDFVFHLAAQPLVRLSYEQPVETYATNVMGTIHVLEALRGLSRPCAAVLVTTDKCYENHERPHGYAEGDPLGGHDPYSSSKAACEIAIASWRRSFFARHPVRVASARAGNVIGGGDWALDRIVPDCVRALARGEPIAVRNPGATRPWQHVLEPVGGYLWLAACLAEPRRAVVAEGLDSAFNFGPGPDANQTVSSLVEEVLKNWPGSWVDKSDPRAVHEATLLQLNMAKAGSLLGWSPVWSFSDAVRQTIGWYRANPAGVDPAKVHAFTHAQIESYGRAAAARGLRWAGGQKADTLKG
ncbi:MAG TPA: CDP-glucose 4,6-dehydratase [Lacunisphaera sp.]|nr:CDP-glucose 4,6-dehydratase [Lacunisphaera sp.]